MISGDEGDGGDDDDEQLVTAQDLLFWRAIIARMNEEEQ